jgi:hypothetical protein
MSIIFHHKQKNKPMEPNMGAPILELVSLELNLMVIIRKSFHDLATKLHCDRT